MRTIAVVSVGRSDYGIYQPVLAEMARRPSLRPLIIAGGMHLSPAFGNTIAEIEADGYEIAARVKMHDAAVGDRPEDIARAIGAGTVGFAEAFARLRPDVTLLLGDRYEMFAAAAAAAPQQLPLAHLHGGEATEGAFDESMRHAITKLSHLHFVSTEAYGRRVRQMGERADRVFVTGAPALDHIPHFEALPAADVSRAAGIDPSRPFIVATYHPVTLASDVGTRGLDSMLEAIAGAKIPAVITYPNADTGGRAFIDTLRAFAARQQDIHLIANLGTRLYFTLLSRAAAMIGNSSSGIIEAASFRLPVVNIGPRQEGRVRARNVIDAGDSREAVRAALERAISPAFRDSLKDLVNPYGDGHAAARIADVLERVPLGPELLVKRFVDMDLERT